MNDSDVYCQKNAHCFTKLLKNYRSHPAILKMPSERFYADELQACADVCLRESLCNWEGLPTKGFPVLFHSIMGEDMREDRSPSFFNPQEVGAVAECVESLINAKGFRVKQKDIGVISPYRKQVR
jgi:helicase MOV-10